MKKISEDILCKRWAKKRRREKARRLFYKIIRFVAFPIVIIDEIGDLRRLYEQEREIRYLKSTLREAADAIRYQRNYYQRELIRRTERFMEMLTWEKKHLKRERRNLKVQYQRKMEVLEQFQKLLEARKVQYQRNLDVLEQFQKLLEARKK